MLGGGTGGGGFGAQSQQGQGSTGTFGGRSGGFGNAAGRGFGAGNGGGAFSGRTLFGAPLPAAGQAAAPAAGGATFGGQREGRGGAAGGPAAAGGGSQQQQPQRGISAPGRGVFARLGMAALREGANPDGSGGNVVAALTHLPGGGRGRSGGFHGVAGPPGVRQGFGGPGPGRVGRGAGRGGGRPWQQQQQQQGARRYTWVAGTHASAASGTDMGMEEGYDGDGVGDDGAPMEQDGSRSGGAYDEDAADGGGAEAEPAAAAQRPSDWRGVPAVAADGQFQAAAAARTPARSPVPVFIEKRATAGTDGGGGGGGEDPATDDDDAVRLKRRQQRFGQSAEAAGGTAAAGTKTGINLGAGAGGVAAAGGDTTPVRIASRSPLRWRPEAEAEPEVRGHSPSPSPQPPLLMSYLGGGGGGDGMIDDDEGGAGGSTALVGTCEVMCPVAERKRREAAGELNIFERLDPHNSKLTTEGLIIKKARKNYSEDDRRPENLRTFRALRLTMARLRSLIAEPDETALAAAIQHTPEQTLLNVQAFLWDRYREVRKEIIAQHFHTHAEMLPQVLSWNEEIARFLIISSHELWGNRDFAAQLNQEQLKKVLTDLVTRFYTSAARLGVPTANSAEIKCYLLILMMGGTIEKNGRRFRQLAEAQMYLRQYTQEELASPWTSVLFAVMATLQSGNPVAFFEIMARAPYTLACICASHVMPMRSLAMHMMAAAMGGPHPDQPGGRPNPDAAIPLLDLARVLKLSEVNASSYAETRQALVQPGGATGQRDVSFLSPQVSSREPRAKPQHWISSKRSRLGRNQDTVNAAELSIELLSCCRQVLAGTPGAAPMQSLPRARGRMIPAGAAATAGGSSGAISAAAATSPTRQTAAAQTPPTSAPTSPFSWELSSGSSRSGTAGIGQASAAAGRFVTGAPPTGSPSEGGSWEGVPSPAKTRGLTSSTRSLSGASAPAGAASAFRGFGTGPVTTAPATPSVALATTMAPSFSQQPIQQQHHQQQHQQAVQQQQQQLLGIQQQQQPQLQLLLQQQQAQQQVLGGFPGFLPAMASAQAPQQQPTPNLVDAGLLAQAQRAAEVERQARENLRHQADQAIRQEHERHRALMMQCEQLAASASAAQAALLEAQRREVTYAEEVKKLRLAQQAKAIEERWCGIMARRCIGKWREGVQKRKRHQEFLRQQLARVSVNFNGGWARGSLGLLRRGCGGGSVSARGELEAGRGPGGSGATVDDQSPTGRKRRHDFTSSIGAGALANAASASGVAASVFARIRKGLLMSPMNLEEVVLPALCRTLARIQGGGTGRPTATSPDSGGGAVSDGGGGRASGRGLRTLRYGSLRGAAAASKTGFRRLEDWELGNRRWSDPALQRNVFWKVLLISGAQEPEARCVSGYQMEAATWLRARLSCGRTVGPRASRQPQLGEQLTINGIRVAIGNQACNLTLCVQDIRATSLAGYGVVSEETAVAVAATSGVMMLVDGRTFEAAFAAGASQQQAAADAAQDLDESWERLRRALGSIPDIDFARQSQFQPQGPTNLPVVILTLGSAAAVAAISSHLAAAAATWPPAVAARVVSSTAAALGGNVRVASLVEAPDEVLRQALLFMAESAPFYDHVVTLDLEEMARGAVAEVVSELDERGPGIGTASATFAAFNHLMAVYEAAVKATATSPSALWGLPAPEVSPSDADAAPACWAPQRVSTVIAELRRLQMPPQSPEQGKLPGGSAVLPQLMGNIATWSATLTGPRKVMMLASFAPSLQRQLRARTGLVLLGTSASLEPLGPDEYGTPVQRPWVMAATSSCGPGLVSVPPPVASEGYNTPAGTSAAAVAVAAAPPTHGGSTLSAASQRYTTTVMEDVMLTPAGPPMAYESAGVGGWSIGGSGPVAAARTTPYCYSEGSHGAGKDGSSAVEMPPDPKRMATEALKNLLAALGA